MSQGFIGGLQVVRRPHCRFISLAFALLIKSDTDIPVGQSRPRGGGGEGRGRRESPLPSWGSLAGPRMATDTRDSREKGIRRLVGVYMDGAGE